MKPLGIDLAKIRAGDRDELPDAPPEAPDCPGAMLRVTRFDLGRLTQGGERFLTGDSIPAAGYGSARVACRNPVEKLGKTAAGNTQFYGLCASCSRLEADNRAVLAERQVDK